MSANISSLPVPMSLEERGRWAQRRIHDLVVLRNAGSLTEEQFDSDIRAITDSTPVQKWDGLMWNQYTLCEAGFIFQLGAEHEGLPCAAASERRTMLVQHNNGMQRVEVSRTLRKGGWPHAGVRRDQLLAAKHDMMHQANRCWRPMERYGSTHFIDVSVGLDDENKEMSTITGDRAIFISDDGSRRKEEMQNITHKKRRVKLRPTGLDDSLASWTPVDILEPNEEDEEIIDTLSGRPGKRKTRSSDRPMDDFRLLKAFFLEETLRHHGLADSTDAPRCALCNACLYGEAAPRFFRCADYGEFLQCQGCCLKRHALMPLHLLMEWKTVMWVRTTLLKLGLCYQLGHEGQACPHPAEFERHMVVMDLTGIHTVRYRYCGCKRSDDTDNLRQLMRNAWFPATTVDPTTCATFNALDFFRLLSVVGNINSHDFVRSLERKMDAVAQSGVSKVPPQDRYKAFMRMSRMYAFLQRIRRAGRGHDPAGLEATQLGEILPRCYACPHDGKNIPTNWRDVDPKWRFLYMLLIAVDANFKLKNRIRVNEQQDNPLGPGWGAFVEPVGYKEHLRTYVAEKDGWGGVVCARHECFLPNGLGDLQKGERYNMDYIVMSALAGFALVMLTLSYDIACQWKINLPTRMGKLPQHLQLDLDKIELQCGLPVWHASSHEKSCQYLNSLSFLWGVGKSDGEGIERVWSIFNLIAWHTKDMGLGNQADTTDDKADSHNFLKNLGQGDALRRKLIIALVERARQVDAFTEINKSITREVRDAWDADIKAFLADRMQPNPYALAHNGMIAITTAGSIADCVPADGPTEAEIRLTLKQEEDAEARRTGAPMHGTSATAFIVGGLQLEASQRRIKAEVAGLRLLTADRESKLHDFRVAFFAKLRKFRKLQLVFSPAAAAAVEAAEGAREADTAPMPAEDVKLFLPSELTTEQRLTCAKGVPEVEARLREGQCANALVSIRAQLHSKRHLITFRNAFLSGQNKTTKARTLIGLVSDRATGNSHKYQRAREALDSLKGKDYAPHFQEMKQEHLTLDGEDVESVTDVASRKKLAMLASGKGSRAPRHISGTSKSTLSWIWTSHGALDDAEKHLHESLKVEWSRAKARKVRWDEEVHLLREEMRRVLRYLDWQVNWWDAKRESRTDITDAAMRGGMRAYAAKQAATCRSLWGFFNSQWSGSVGEIARSVIDDDAVDLGSFFE
ncbi:hypothetical protein C8R43DRAFT_966146 [Mycena crocata]|nr:hypothetical protein C8R43DRAFT_966146 [Mycena crocata]